MMSLMCLEVINESSEEAFDTQKAFDVVNHVILIKFNCLKKKKAYPSTCGMLWINYTMVCYQNFTDRGNSVTVLRYFRVLDREQSGHLTGHVIWT